MLKHSQVKQFLLLKNHRDPLGKIRRVAHGAQALCATRVFIIKQIAQFLLRDLVQNYYLHFS